MADTCGQVLLGTGLTVLSHPLMYIKVLVQVRPCLLRGMAVLASEPKHVSRCESVYSDLPSANFSSFLSFLFVNSPGILFDIKPILWSGRSWSPRTMHYLFETRNCPLGNVISMYKLGNLLAVAYVCRWLRLGC